MIPAIICLGFNRPNSLQRLLGSLESAHYGEAVPLVISLDQDGTMGSFQVAQDFIWSHGPKRVIHHPERLGLREHVLRCGDLVEEYGAVVILEDDVVVAPGFYRYLMASMDRYAEDARIAGVALYSHRFCQNARQIFQPIPTGDSTYFLKFPCSWGQAWTREQWRGFRTWLASHPEEPMHPDLPKLVQRWPTTSWLKLFASYDLYADKTWVYPFDAYSTNSGEAGTHMARGTVTWQLPLLTGEPCGYRFPELGTTLAEYDQHYENCSKALRKDLPVPAEDVELDLYGMKQPNEYRKPWLLTTRLGKHAKARFALSYRPWEANILRKESGNDVLLLRRDDIAWNSSRAVDLPFFEYHHPNRMKLSEWFWLFMKRVKRQILKRLGRPV